MSAQQPPPMTRPLCIYSHQGRGAGRVHEGKRLTPGQDLQLRHNMSDGSLCLHRSAFEVPACLVPGLLDECGQVGAMDGGFYIVSLNSSPLPREHVI